MSKSMDEEYTNSLLIERYLQGKMSDEEMASFEEHFLSSNDLLAELESAERLQQGLQDVAALERSSTHGAYSEPEKSGSGFTSLFRSPRYAMAASFMLFVSLGVSSILIQQNIRLGEGGPEIAVPAEIIPLVSVRGIPVSGSLNTLYLSEPAQQFVLMIEPGYETYSRHRASIFKMEPTTGPVLFLQVDNLLPGYEDMLAVGLPGSILVAGDFEIRLEGWRDEWQADHAYDQISTIHFRCVDK